MPQIVPVDLGQLKPGSDSKFDLKHELNIKHVQFNNALVAALGLSLSAVVAPDQEPNARMAMFMGDAETFRVAIPGQGFKVKLHAVNQGGTSAKLTWLSVDPASGSSWGKAGTDMLQDKPVFDIAFNVTAPADAPFTRPYFTRPDIEQSYYDLKDAQFLNQPLAPYPLAGWAEWTFEGVTIKAGNVVQTVKRITGQGTVLEPLMTGPAIGIAIAPRFGVVPLNAKSFDVKTVLHSNVKGAAKGAVRLDLPAGWKSQPSSIDFATSNPGCKARAMTAIYADTSAAAQLELVKEIFGQAANVLVLSSELSVDTEKAFSAAARSLGLNITIERTNASTPIFRLLTKHPNFDLVLAIPDRSIYQPETVRVLLEATYRRSKPMIGFNTSTVQAGMLAATYPSQEDVLEMLDDLIARFSSKRELPTPKYVKHWRVAVNENVARSLSIAISDEAKSLGRSARSKVP